MSIGNLSEAQYFMKNWFRDLDESKIRTVVVGLMAGKPLIRYWKKPPGQQRGLMSKRSATKIRKLYDQGELKEYVDFLSATSEIEIEQQATQLLASAKQKPQTPLQQEVWEKCSIGDHEWMRDSKYEGQAFTRKFWFETNGSSMLGRTKLTCWFCHHVDMR